MSIVKFNTLIPKFEIPNATVVVAHCHHVAILLQRPIHGVLWILCGSLQRACNIPYRFEWLAITKDTRHILGWVFKLPAKFEMLTK